VPQNQTFREKMNQFRLSFAKVIDTDPKSTRIIRRTPTWDVGDLRLCHTRRGQAFGGITRNESFQTCPNERGLFANSGRLWSALQEVSVNKLELFAHASVCTNDAHQEQRRRQAPRNDLTRTARRWHCVTVRVPNRWLTACQ
jgi:hypothetical protein